MSVKSSTKGTSTSLLGSPLIQSIISALDRSVSITGILLVLILSQVVEARGRGGGGGGSSGGGGGGGIYTTGGAAAFGATSTNRNSSSTNDGGSKLSLGLILAIIFIPLGLVAVSIIIFCICKRRGRDKPEQMFRREVAAMDKAKEEQTVFRTRIDREWLPPSGKWRGTFREQQNVFENETTLEFPLNGTISGTYKDKDGEATLAGYYYEKSSSSDGSSNNNKLYLFWMETYERYGLKTFCKGSCDVPGGKHIQGTYTSNSGIAGTFDSHFVSNTEEPQQDDFYKV